jgi:hypothetical protein
MTAEIAVMNREAVALAADSAVTLDFSTGPKVFSSANKIFALSSAQPVGVMIFGDAAFVGMPWETIIKEFRKSLGKEMLPTIGDYTERFFEKLLSHAAFTGDEQQQRSFSSLIYETYHAVLRSFLGMVEQELENKTTIDENEVRELLAAQVRYHYDAWRETTPLEDVPDGFAALIRRQYSEEIKELRELVFEDLPMSSATSRALGELAGLVFVQTVPSSVDIVYSGIVIAGFGTEEFFPHLIRQMIYGVAGGRLRLEGREEIVIHRDNNAVIAPFAQREMVNAFIEGLEPSYGQLAEEATHRLANDLMSAVLRQAGLDASESAKILEGVGPEVSSRFDALAEELRAIRLERHALPIIDVVAALPKDELAAMAESLVNLTSFKRRVSKSAETVGGPIDVAVISRGGGFVWIKRKHYFPSELNPRYMANLRGAASG